MGSGRKAANIFAENQTLIWHKPTNFNSLKMGVIFMDLNPEKALNYGVSVRKIFSLWGGDGDITADYYVTDFTDQVVVDWEEKGRISFYNLERKKQG